jgi:hypothetical protein
MNSTGYSATGESGEYGVDARIQRVRYDDDGIFVSGFFTLTRGCAELDTLNDGVLLSDLGVQVQLHLSDDGTQKNDCYVQRVVSCNGTAAGRIRCVPQEGSGSRPRMHAKSVSGRGCVNGCIVTLIFPGCLPNDAAAVYAGFSFNFDCKLCPINPSSRIPKPACLNVALCNHSLGKTVPSMAEFRDYDAMKPPFEFQDQNLKISVAGLEDLSSRLGDETLSLAHLMIETDTGAFTGAGVPDTIKLPSSLAVQGHLLVSISHMAYGTGDTSDASCPAGTQLVISTPANRASPIVGTCYFLTEEYTVDADATTETATVTDGVRTWKHKILGGYTTAGTYPAGTIIVKESTSTRLLLPSVYGAWDNRQFKTGYTLPGIEISGSVGGDIVIMGPPPNAMPSISPSLKLNGGKLLGRVRTPRADVTFGSLTCENGSFMDSGSSVRVAAAFSDVSFGVITYPDVNTAVVVEKSAMLADIESVAVVITVTESTLGNLSNVAYGMAPLRIGLSESRCGAVNLRLLDVTSEFPTSTGQYKVTSCILGSYMFLGMASESTDILDSEVKGALALWDPEGSAPKDNSPGVTAMIMSNATGCCRVGSFRLESPCTLAVTGGRLDIASVSDGRVDTSGWTDPSRGKSVIVAIESVVNIGRMTLMAALDFPCSPGCLEGSSLNIGVLDLLAAGSNPFALHLSCGGVTARSVIDRNGLVNGLTIIRGRIGEFCVPETNTEDLTLDCTDSHVKLVCRIPSGGATATMTLMHSQGSVVDVSGRLLSNLGYADSVDNTSTLILADGSSISYANDSAKILVPGKRFEDLVIAYPNPEAPESPAATLQITFPDPAVAADAAVSQLLRYAYLYNKCRAIIAVTGTVESRDPKEKVYKIQPEIFRNMASVGTIPRLYFNDAMFS